MLHGYGYAPSRATDGAWVLLHVEIPGRGGRGGGRGGGGGGGGGGRLDAAGHALSRDVLLPFLGGAGRDFFERSFGLDPGRLAEGAMDLLRSGGDVGRAVLQATGADAVITGNIGCINQIRTHLELLNKPLPLWHTVEVLDWAYRGASVGD